MDEIISDFIVESTESLEALDSRFVELEKNPEDATLLNDIFRSVHTIKGAAGFLGFEQMVEVTHVTEDVLNKLRKGELKTDPAIMDAILDSVDLIRVLLNNIREKNGRTEDTAPVIAALRVILEGGAPASGQAPVEKACSTDADADGKGPEQTDAAAPDVLGTAQKPKTADGKAARPGAREEPAHTKEKEHSIRVDIDRLDSVLNLAGELVLARNRLMKLGTRLGELDTDCDLVSHMDEGISQLDLVTTDLQLAVMKMRMQPIAKVFNKFPRMVRDLARQNDKDVELVITGEETELDKTVIEEIGDPLVHLVRNALDHGMDTPEEREAAGKQRRGTVTLAAYQEGRHIIVSVADDGRGIDPAAIRKSAVDKGLISEDDAGRLSDRDSLNLIFIPGFSTAKKVSNISGRGVGMDVVKTNISKINGTITIDSEVGKGTRIVFRLPLTLAIIQALTVEAGGEVYGIPLSTVIENIRVAPDEIKSVDGRDVIHIRDRVFPVVKLGELVTGSSNSSSDWQYIVIIGVGDKTFGILVDRLHGQEEIVMKSMGEYLKGTDGIAGACITGDGNVILILDVCGLLESLQRVYVH
ncbi:MAG: chemotaxis protein CheA [Thermodesulfobacteriota bacterium]